MKKRILAVLAFFFAASIALASVRHNQHWENTIGGCTFEVRVQSTGQQQVRCRADGSDDWSGWVDSTQASDGGVFASDPSRVLVSDGQKFSVDAGRAYIRNAKGRWVELRLKRNAEATVGGEGEGTLPVNQI